jgi:hypothetical protein
MNNSFARWKRTRFLAHDIWRLLNRVGPAEQGAIRKRIGALVATERELREQECQDDKGAPSEPRRTGLGLEYLIHELDSFIAEMHRLVREDRGTRTQGVRRGVSQMTRTKARPRRTLAAACYGTGMTATFPYAVTDKRRRHARTERRIRQGAISPFGTSSGMVAWS